MRLKTLIQDIKLKEFPKISSDLSAVNKSFGELAQADRTDKAGTLQRAVTECNDRWDALNQRANSAAESLEKAIEAKENFDKNLQSVKKWLSGLDDELTAAETYTDEQMQAKVKVVNALFALLYRVLCSTFVSGNCYCMEQVKLPQVTVNHTS